MGSLFLWLLGLSECAQSSDCEGSEREDAVDAYLNECETQCELGAELGLEEASTCSSPRGYDARPYSGALGEASICEQWHDEAQNCFRYGYAAAYADEWERAECEGSVSSSVRSDAEFNREVCVFESAD